MPSYRPAFFQFLTAIIVFQLIVVLTAGLCRPFWGDEAHFVETIRLFGNSFSLETLRTYNEMSTPLPFMLYAAWGKLFGFGIATLRLLSLLIAAATYLSFHRLVWNIRHDGQMAFWLTLFLMVHPYNVGLSIFVFTDMLAILTVVLTLHAARQSNAALLGLSLAAGILCRQYLIYVALAVAIYFITMWISDRRRSQHIACLIATVLAILPFFALALFWDGLSPENNLRQLYVSKSLSYEPEFLVAYVSIFGIYLFPLLAVRWRWWTCDSLTLIAAFLLSPLYWFYPIAVSAPSAAIGLTTIGLYHRFLVSVAGHGSIEQAVFYAGFLVGLIVLLSVVRRVVAQFRQSANTELLLYSLMVLAFLLVMPFSYLCWEKYIMPLIPAAILVVWAGQLGAYGSRPGPVVSPKPRSTNWPLGNGRQTA